MPRLVRNILTGIALFLLVLPGTVSAGEAAAPSLQSIQEQIASLQEQLSEAMGTIRAGQSVPRASAPQPDLRDLPPMPAGDAQPTRAQADQYYSFFLRYLWGETVWFEVSDGSLDGIMSLLNRRGENIMRQSTLPLRRDCPQFEAAVSGLRELVQDTKRALLTNLSQSGVQLSNGMWDVKSSRGSAALTARKCLLQCRTNWEIMFQLHYLFDDEPIAKLGTLQFGASPHSRVNRVAGPGPFLAKKTPETREYPYRQGEPRWQVDNEMVPSAAGREEFRREYAYANPAGLALLNAPKITSDNALSFDSTAIPSTTYVVQAAAGGQTKAAFLDIYPNEPWEMELSINMGADSEGKRSLGFDYGNSQRSPGASIQTPDFTLPSEYELLAPPDPNQKRRSQTEKGASFKLRYSCSWEDAGVGDFPEGLPDVRITETQEYALSGRIGLDGTIPTPVFLFGIRLSIYLGLEGSVEGSLSQTRAFHVSDPQKPSYVFDYTPDIKGAGTVRAGLQADLFHENLLSLRGGVAAELAMRTNRSAGALIALEMECPEIAFEYDVKGAWGLFATNGRYRLAGPFPLFRCSFLKEKPYAQFQSLLGSRRRN